MSYTIPAWRTTTKVGSGRNGSTSNTRAESKSTSSTRNRTRMEGTTTNADESQASGRAQKDATSTAADVSKGGSSGIKKISVYSKPRQDAEIELVPFPDLFDLFAAYDQIYFNGMLTASGVYVRWSNRMTSCAGICRMGSGIGIEIALSEPLLQMRSSLDFKETLLHEMIHALDFLQPKRKRDHDGHGEFFQKKQNEINTSQLVDPYKPAMGYHITVYHSWTNEVDSHKRHHWKCSLCGHVVKRTMNRPPTEKDCRHYRKDGSLWRFPQNAVTNKCGDPNCFHHNHMRTCLRGEFVKITHPESKTEREKRVREQEKKAADEKGGVKKQSQNKKPKPEITLDPRQTELDFKPKSATKHDTKSASFTTKSTDGRNSNTHAHNEITVGTKQRDPLVYIKEGGDRIKKDTHNVAIRQGKANDVRDGITYLGTSTGPRTLGADNYLGRRKGARTDKGVDKVAGITLGISSGGRISSGRGKVADMGLSLAKDTHRRDTQAGIKGVPGRKVVEIINLDSSDDECVSSWRGATERHTAMPEPHTTHTGTTNTNTSTMDRTSQRPIEDINSFTEHNVNGTSVFPNSVPASEKKPAKAVKTSWGTGFVLGKCEELQKTSFGCDKAWVNLSGRVKNMAGICIDNNETAESSSKSDGTVDRSTTSKGMKSIDRNTKDSTLVGINYESRHTKGTCTHARHTTVGSVSCNNLNDTSRFSGVDKTTKLSSQVDVGGEGNVSDQSSVDSRFPADSTAHTNRQTDINGIAHVGSKAHTHCKANLTVPELWGVKVPNNVNEATTRRSEELVMSVAMVTRARAAELLAECDGSAEKAIDRHYS